MHFVLDVVERMLSSNEGVRVLCSDSLFIFFAVGSGKMTIFVRETSNIYKRIAERN